MDLRIFAGSRVQTRSHLDKSLVGWLARTFPSRMLRLLSIFLYFTSLPPLAAQAPTAPPAAVQESPPSNKRDALESLILTLQADEKDLERLGAEIKAATLEEKKKELATESTKLSEKIKAKKQELATTATGIDSAKLSDQTAKDFSIQDEIKNIFSPLMREMREATAQPREIENLTIEIQRWEKKRTISEEALRNLDIALAETISPELKTRLTSLRKSWVKQQNDALSQVKNLNIQLGERKKNAPSVLSAITKSLSYFWRNRGLSILLAVITSFIVFSLFRRVYRFGCRYSPLHQRGETCIAARLLDVIASGTAILIALLSTLFVFYVRNDWLLLTASFIFLIGLAWVSRTAFPPYFEQIRLILNLGNVRIGERIIYNGLPWKVKSLNFFSKLENPALSGGLIQIPAKALLQSHSRPTMPDEPWFPTYVGEWVRLEDGLIGKIVHQTPEQVVLENLSGAAVTYTISNYLAKTPENLSKRFGVSTNFGLDCRYQSIATTTIPQVIQAKVRDLLEDKYPAEAILAVGVEFSSASPSSLDFTIMCAADGSLASQYPAIIRLLQQAAIDAANENDWVLPFPQLTIHRPRA